jgi:putative protease
MRELPEILAPAGGMEALITAVRSGANAVYLGTQNFNARRNAKNFDEEGLKQAVSYCHARGVKVYATLNTLVFDKEIPALVEEIYRLADSSVDALIVQDLGVAALCRHICPALSLHASTQMTIHNAAGAKALEALGFSRVVLARELTEAEIRAISEETALELEVFVHGALCMSVSGQCRISAMLGGRSGNRGLCAQPCRLNFISQGREYALSLKDLSLVPRMERLKNMRIAALKIEGRMKRPEYVAAAVSACKDALTGETPDMETLRAVFSRSGFTQGYFEGNRDLSMFGTRTKEDVTAAAGALNSIAQTYRNETPLVPVDVRLTLADGVPVILTAADGERTVTIEGPVPEAAQTKSLTRELAAHSLAKTGGTPFFIRTLETSLAEGLSLPLSAINQLRKQALENLLEARGHLRPLPCNDIDTTLPQKKHTAKAPALRLRFEHAAQVSDEALQHADKIILPMEEIDAAMLARCGKKLIAEPPLLIFPSNEKRTQQTLVRLREMGLSSVLAGNPGIFTLAKAAGLAPHADHTLNILNSHALRAVQEMGAKDATLSFECGMRAAADIAGIPAGIIAYGYLPLMAFRNCPAKTEKGCEGCKGQAHITDRLGKSFALSCRSREYTLLHNPLPLYMADKPEDLAQFDFVTLYFTAENAEACAKIVRAYLAHTPPEGEFTRGLYYRTLE